MVASFLHRVVVAVVDDLMIRCRRAECYHGQKWGYQMGMEVEREWRVRERKKTECEGLELCKVIHSVSLGILWSWRRGLVIPRVDCGRHTYCSLVRPYATIGKLILSHRSDCFTWWFPSLVSSISIRFLFSFYIPPLPSRSRPTSKCPNSSLGMFSPRFAGRGEG